MREQSAVESGELEGVHASGEEGHRRRLTQATSHLGCSKAFLGQPELLHASFGCFKSRFCKK